MFSGQRVAVIIPARDEESALPVVLARIPKWVDVVFVVDNGSSDGTARVAAAAGARVVDEPVPGYGRACLAGIAAATAPDVAPDVLVFLDADGSDFPEQMERLVAPLAARTADLVIGSRNLGTMFPGAMTPPQRFGNVLAPFLIRTIWGVHFTDLGPFRAVRASELARLEMDDPTFGWTVQMQIRAARIGLRCAEVAVDYTRRLSGRSKISGTVRGVFAAGTKILWCIASEALRPAHALKRAATSERPPER